MHHKHANQWRIILPKPLPLPSLNIAEKGYITESRKKGCFMVSHQSTHRHLMHQKITLTNPCKLLVN